jgi:hypothetical protein
MGFVSAQDIENAPSGTFLSMDEVQGKRAPDGDGIGQFVSDYYDYLHQPTEKPADAKDFLTRVVPESISKTAVGLPEFPYMVGKGIGDVIQKRAIEGEPAINSDTGEPSTAGRLADTLAGIGEEGAKNVVGMAKFVGEPTGMYGWETFKEKWATDPAGAMLAVYPLVKSGVVSARKVREYVAKNKPKVEPKGNFVSADEVKGTPPPEAPPAEAGTFIPAEDVRPTRSAFKEADVPDIPTVENDIGVVKSQLDTLTGELAAGDYSGPTGKIGLLGSIKQAKDSLSALEKRKAELAPTPEGGLFPEEKKFGLAAEEAPVAEVPFRPAAVEQPLLGGTEKAYKDVGMREKPAALPDAIGEQVDSLRSILPDFEQGKRLWSADSREVIGNTPNMYPPWFKEVFRNDSAKLVMDTIDKWKEKGDASLTKKEARIMASVKDLAKDSADRGVDIAVEHWRDMMPEGGLAEDVSGAIPEAIPAAGLSVRPVDVVTPKPSFTESDLKFGDAATETRYTEAHGVKPVPTMDKVRETLGTLKNKATREYEHLPRTAEFAPLRYKLLELAKQKGVASDRSVRAMQGITIRLDKTRMGLFERKVLLDDLTGEAGKGHDLPFGFTPESLAKERARIDSLAASDPIVSEALGKRTAFADVVRKDYVGAMKDIGLDVGDSFDNPAYFRHQVLEYANLKSVTGTGKKLRTPTGRGFQKERKGSELDINTNYLEAEHEVTAQMLHDIEVARAIRLVDEKYNIAGKVGDGPVPEGYVAWQPREGNVFYLTDTIPARLAEKLKSGALEEIGVTAKDLGNALAMGGPRKRFIVRQEVADTLNNIVKAKPQGALLGLDRKIVGYWKVWQLVSPRRWLKYNFRNLTGDADAAFVGSTSVFRKAPQAVKELYQVFKADRGMTPEMREWFRRGGFETTLQAQELHELNRFDVFKHIRDPKESIASLPVRAFKKYWEKATVSTNFRESVLRYSAYLDYLEQMKADPKGTPKNFGASIPEEVMALPDIRDRAFVLSNQLLGAYDQVSVMGNALRDHVYPFWSWKEVNFKRYIQFAKNAANDGKLAETVGRKAVGTAANPMTYVRVGTFLIKATALWSMLQAWNNLRFPKEERELDVNTRNRPHIIFGRGKDGKIINFTNLGALGDFLAWFGLDAFPLQVSNWTQGKRTLREIALEMIKSPVNVVTQGVTPVAKMPAELLTGKQLFPDAFNPRGIRDRAYYVAQSIGLGDEYKALARMPSEGYAKSMSKFFVYESDPGQNAFNDIHEEKARFMEKIGKGGEGGFMSPKSNALYNLRLAIKLKDKDAAKKYGDEYAKMGGTQKGFMASLQRMHPLASLKPNERAAFVATLTSEDREKLIRAIHFYDTVMLGR